MQIHSELLSPKKITPVLLTIILENRYEIDFLCQAIENQPTANQGFQVMKQNLLSQLSIARDYFHHP